MMHTFFVFVGGGLGCLLRYGLWKFIPQGTFPTATLLANFLAIGLMGLVFMIRHPAPWLHPLLLAGFCGGLSTFSGFSFETAALIRAGLLWAAAANILVSVLGGICLAWMVYKFQ
ncbi:MAG: FluC/FEX family fluoride channel [Bacteroidota bacterium]|jgi:CrcB protein